MSDNRKYTRIPEHIRIEYRIITLGDETHWSHPQGGGMTENISEGGMLIETREEIPVGSVLEIRFDIRGVEFPLFIKARVLRLIPLPGERFDVGVKFTHYFMRDQEILREHLKDFAEMLELAEGLGPSGKTRD